MLPGEENVCFWELQSTWFQQFSLVCGGGVAWMVPCLTSCPEIAWGLSASESVQVVPGTGAASTAGHCQLTEGPSLLFTYKYTRGKFPRPLGGYMALTKWHFDELSINELEMFR